MKVRRVQLPRHLLVPLALHAPNNVPRRAADRTRNDIRRSPVTALLEVQRTRHTTRRVLDAHLATVLEVLRAHHQVPNE